MRWTPVLALLVGCSVDPWWNGGQSGSEVTSSSCGRTEVSSVSSPTGDLDGALPFDIASLDAFVGTWEGRLDAGTALDLVIEPVGEATLTTFDTCVPLFAWEGEVKWGSQNGEVVVVEWDGPEGVLNATLAEGEGVGWFAAGSSDAVRWTATLASSSQ